MTILLSERLQAMQGRDIIDELGAKLYRPPLDAMRHELKNITEAAQTFILILDFDTEVQINGILGFLENSTGIYFTETINAFQRVGAAKTADILEKIEGITQSFGISPQAIHQDVQNVEEFTVTSFSQLHGNDASVMGEHIENEAKHLYVYHKEGEPIFELLAVYINSKKDELLDSVRKYEKGNILQ